ncbi:outer membrane protein [Roseicyclus mahoneyensis]|uniref:Uncharacterized protein n=1 Tax=Roseicyclus mahoneyensis TaxID=164332 RepID=A0A316GLK1_9RHOB|nr:hypothetical protein [Roseicyclus mahoneyensis]PWK60809.1 hypothetical protein C7455_1036 [Roseicyclus mahoneyensis]
MAFDIFGGCLFQSGSLVYWGELGYVSHDSQFINFPAFSIKGILELRGRVGYATGRLPVSASIGYARQEYADAFSPLSIDMDGITDRLGVEYAVTDRVFMGLEYVVRDIERTDPFPSQMGVEAESIRSSWVVLRF